MTAGCYELVGEDQYTSIQFEGMDDNLVDRTLEQANFLSVQPGDVVGFSTPRSGRSGRIQLNSDYHDESIWFTTDIVENEVVCPGSGGSLRNFSSAAPVLSVAISKCTVWSFSTWGHYWPLHSSIDRPLSFMGSQLRRRACLNSACIHALTTEVVQALAACMGLQGKACLYL